MSSPLFAFAAGLLLAGSPVNEGGHETELADTLRAVTIVADRGMVVSRTDTLTVRTNDNVTEILQRLPGVSVNDNGGLAGLKSVSLRGLGSAHTAIYIDGVRAGNVQSGQTDLGFINLSEIGSTVVDYAQNSISFITRKPEFSQGRKTAGRASVQGGSFGTWMPSGRFDFKASDNVSISANASANISEGNFTYGDGLERTNNDIEQYQAGLDAFGRIERGSWHAKAGWNKAERGTPGSTDWPSTDRQNDRNAYVQGMFQKSFSGLYSLSASAKASSDVINYFSEWGDSEYDQTEYQINTSHHMRISDWWNLSAAADLLWDGLESTSYNSTRTTFVGTLGSAFAFGKFRADLAAEFMGAHDKDEASSDDRFRNSLSPSLDIRYGVLKNLDIVAFSRRAYRIPTFNELYYAGYGNPDLLPEDAWLSDIGVEWHSSTKGAWKSGIKVDGFYNKLKDKIISAPSVNDPYTWLPYNIGKVSAAGIDISSTVGYERNGWETGIYAHYSWQSALDKTPDSATFDQQIPYVAKHTASVSGNVTKCGWSFIAYWNARIGRNDSYGEMPSWNTIDIKLSKEISFRNSSSITFNLSANNLADCKYEIVRYYPVPGRNFLAGMEFKF